MKNTVKCIVIIASVVLAVCLIPFRTQYKDGGSVGYKAVLYEVTKWHSLSEVEPDGYKDGLQIKVLGLTVYDKWYD